MLEPLGNAPRDGTRTLITLSMRRSTAIAIVLSLLVHVLMIGYVVHQRMNAGVPESGHPGPITARLQPQPKPPAPAPAAQPEPPAAVTPPTPAPPPRTPQPRRNPAITTPRPAPRSAPPAVFPPLLPPAPPTPSPPDNNPDTDMMANMQARRAQREGAAGAAGASAPSGNDIALRNLQSLQKSGISGIFTITRMGQREGEFTFNGWTTDARNSKRQFFVVDAGLGGDLELAMIREMIKLIRRHYSGDFNFESHRLGRVQILSARPQDSAELEAFLRLEFFGRPR